MIASISENLPSYLKGTPIGAKLGVVFCYLAFRMPVDPVPEITLLPIKTLVIGLKCMGSAWHISLYL